MPRIPRMVRSDSGQRTVYHVISRTALDGLPFKHVEKDELVRVIQRFSMVYAVDVLGYVVMGNHFHVLAEVCPSSLLSDDEVRRRFMLLYNTGAEFPEGQIEHYRERFSSLSHYRWCSIGYHVQTGNRDDFLSLDFGLVEFGVENSQRLKKYREYLYHAGAVGKRGKAKISKKALEKESAEGFEMDRIRRFRYRTRYFTDSGVIGSRAFVSATHEVFKDRFYSSREKIPSRVKGIDGMYSLKRLTEA